MRRSFGVVLAMACSVSSLVGAIALPAWAEGFPTVDGQFSGTGPIGSGGTVELTVLGRGGVPLSGVDAVALNVTATAGTGESFLTVWPTGTSRPTASNVNFVAGQTVPNMVIAKVGSGGRVSIFNYASTVDVIVDVLGWFPSGGGYTGLTPARLLETRPGYPTVDGGAAGGGLVSPGGVVDLTVVGRGNVPASGVDSVVLNVTVTGASTSSYVTVWPTGEQRPVASSVNVTAGKTVPNLVVAKVGAGGQVSLFNFAGTTHLIVDVLGWFPTGGSFASLTPSRILETRAGEPGYLGGTSLAAGETRALQVTDRGGVPAFGVEAVAVNVTVTGPSSESYLSVFPDGGNRPNASNLNFVAGQTTANLVVAKLSPTGAISIFNFAGSAHVIVDVLGWFPTGGSFTGLSPARLMDTRIVPPPPPPPPTIFTLRAGTLVVGANAPPGRYIAASAKDGCYWERLSGFSGAFEDIIANDFRGFDGPTIVDILPGDVGFSFRAACGTFRTWTAPAATVSFVFPGSRTVGSEIVAGTYATNALSGCYWERLSGFSGSFDDIIANDFVGTAGQQIVTISASDVGFYSDADCGVWTRL